MPIQQLQQSRALSVVTSDAGGIYKPWEAILTDETATTTNPAFIDATGVDFTKISVGDIVVSTGGSGSFANAVITAVDPSIPRIACDTTGFTGAEFSVFKPTSALLYVGGTGDVVTTTAGGDSVTFVGVPAGTYLPVHIKKVSATGTSATGILALW